MISHLRGSVVSATTGSCVIECGGVGYEVHCPVETAARLRPGQEILLHVHHHLSIDHAGGGGECLYGFSAPEDKGVFRLLMTVSGVGPRLALLILSSESTQTVLSALARKDTTYLRSFKGVGPKMADRLVLELSEKARLLSGPKGALGTGSSPEFNDAVSALVSLGYEENQAVKAVAEALKDRPTADAGELVKSALKKL